MEITREFLVAEMAGVEKLHAEGERKMAQLDGAIAVLKALIARLDTSEEEPNVSN